MTMMSATDCLEPECKSVHVQELSDFSLENTVHTFHKELCQHYWERLNQDASLQVLGKSIINTDLPNTA